MCGIAGIYCFEGTNTIESELLVRMRDTMLHRGPDDAGVWTSPDRRVGLAHRRLSIVDLSLDARQPMANEDGSLQVVFNGEIYNHAEIRTELEQRGNHRWKTDHSDTEVILHAFEEWGIDCVHRFRGMFAIALWDARKHTLWLIRDRIGIKPLYYSVGNGRISFASEIKALLVVPGQKRAVNEEAFFHYLSFLTTPAPQTLFDGIRKLPGGVYLKIDDSGNVTEQRYWDVWDQASSLADCSEKEIAERLLEEIKTAVHYRQVSDVPVGVFLSGGIDSSVNAALFSQSEGQALNTFSIGYDEEYPSYPNEFDYARKVADYTGANHHEKRLTLDELLDFLSTMVRLQDEPIADPVCVPVYYVSKLARDHGVIVCQVGEGADELFWGYPWWRTVLQMERINRFPFIAGASSLGSAALKALKRPNSVYAEWLRRSSLHQPLFWGGAEAFNNAEKQRLLSPRLKQAFKHYTSWEVLKPIHQRYSDNAWERSPLHWMSYCDLNLRLPELLLMRVDKMSMGVSLECRVPFLDHKVVELALSIPEAVKTRNGELKTILKQAVKGLVPDSVLNRKKQGFGVPVSEWLLDRLGETVRTELQSFCHETDFFDPDEVTQVLDRKNDPRTWYLLNMALWWKTFIANTP